MKKKVILCSILCMLVIAFVGLLSNEDTYASSKTNLKTLNLYVSTTGNDKNVGTSSSKPVKTLTRLVNVMKTNANKYNIETLNIYVQPGTYRNQNFNISFYPAKKVNFIGKMDSSGNKPIFISNASNTKEGKRYFAYINNKNNNAYKISNITVSRYSNGIFFRGDKNKKGQGGNWLENIYFTKMGDYYSYEGSQKNTNTSEIGYAAVEFTYTSNNVMRNCTVSEARNRTGNYIHGVYIANNSCGNRVYKNKFYHIKPDPVRIRNGSNDNRIYSNNFINTGIYAYVSDWYNGSVGEKKSYGNLVYRNKFYGKYNDGKKEFLSLDQIAIFYSKQAKKDKANASRLKATQNVIIKSKKDKNYNKNVFIY